MNCNECKELLVEYIEGLLDESQKQAVSEHLKDCQTCQTEIDELTNIQNRLIKNSKEITQSNIENKVMDNIVREQNVMLKDTAAKANPALKLRKNIMKSPLAKLAAAAIIIIAVLIGINPFKTSITIAQVVKPILNSEKIFFDMILGSGDTGMITHEIVVGSRIRRTMSTMPNMTMIIDLDNAQLLSLDTDSKTCFYADIEGDLRDMTQSYIGFVREIIRQLQDDQVENLGERIIDGQKTIGFQGGGKNEQVTIWADSQTAIPILIEVHIGQEMAFTMKNFEFDAQVDESLVSMDVPNGYTLKDAQIDLGNATEEDFIESMRIWAEVIRDGSFPEAIGTEATMEQMPVLVENISQMNISEEEETQIGVTFGKGMFFLQVLETRGSWFYNGDGVKFGDSDAPVFWYQPEGSATYRVIYGDLHVEDVAQENLPN